MDFAINYSKTTGYPFEVKVGRIWMLISFPLPYAHTKENQLQADLKPKVKGKSTKLSGENMR